MKKVLFLGRFPPPIHGAALMNENYFNALKNDKDFSVKRIKINYSEKLEELGKINIRKFFGFFIVFFKILYYLLFFRPDIIYFELAPRGFAFYRDSVYVILCKLFRRKIIFHFHAKGISLRKNKLSKIYTKIILRKSKVILLSNFLYFDVKEFVDKKDIIVIPNGIKDELDNRKSARIINKRLGNKKTNLLLLSNMIESKGPLDVLKICNYLKEQKVNFKCNFVGSFQDENFKRRFFQELKKLRLEKYCFYLGPRYNNEKWKILEKTDFLIFPTKYDKEVFPVVILEALMYGIPVFSYDNAAIKEIISEDFLGFVAEQGKWQDLAKELYKKIKFRKIVYMKIRSYFKRKYLFKISYEKLKSTLINY